MAGGRLDITDVEVIAPNFKQRLSGVTSTIIQLVPAQNRLGQRVATLGPGLPADLAHIGFLDLWALRKPPSRRPFRIWHARRNNEMLFGLFLRDILRFPLKLVFTSASQRSHTRWSRFLISRMDQVIATSRKTAGYLKRPGTVITHGIDTDRFCPAVDKPAARAAVGLPEHALIAGCFGRIRHQKGSDIFVDAMIGLLADRPNWIAVLAGRATAAHIAFENELKTRIGKAGLSNRIRFVGEHSDIEAWYRCLDLFIAPQRWEGFGLTPLEAMASGVATVATDVGAFSELLAMDDRETGLLVAPDNLEAMIAAAATLMDSPTRRENAGNHGRERATAHFSVAVEAAAVGHVYGKIFAVSG